MRCFRLRVLEIIASAVLLALVAGCHGSSSSAPATHATQARTDETSPADLAQPPVQGAVDHSRVTFLEHPLKDDVRYSNGSSSSINSIVETLGGGVAAFDYDRDGIIDLFFPGGGRFTSSPAAEGLPSRLLRGDGSCRFYAVSAGAEASRYFTHGCWAADMDHDGFGDLLVTGYGGLQLLHNQGDGTFSPVTEAARLIDAAWSTGVAWGDVNRDGNLDLYVAHYVDWSFQNHHSCDDPHGGRTEICGPKYYGAVDDRLFLSNGDGTFDDATSRAGLIPGGKGLGVVMGDFDLDGDLDVYVANDTTENFLYLNRGDGRFDEEGQLKGVALDDSGRPTGSMGVDLVDFDADGLPDLWTANYEHEIFGLYRNLGQGRYLHVSRPMGFAAIGDRFVGWGTGFADFDRDGDLDVIATTGHVKKFPETSAVKQLPLLWLQNRGRFERESFAADSYLGTPHDGRGLSLTDFDDDGDVDVVIVHNDRQPAVLSNETVTDGGWLRVQLIGRQSSRDPIGARLGLRSGNQTVWRYIQGGGSYLSQADLRPHWGIPKGSRAESLEIHWPSGLVQVIDDLQQDCTMVIIEPSDIRDR